MNKKLIFVIYLCVFLSLTVLSDTKKYEGPFIKELKDGKFESNHFNSISFGSVSFLKKKKLTSPNEKITIRVVKDGSKRIDTFSIVNGDYFLLQSVGSLFTIKDIFFRKKYYKIDKKFSASKSNLNYLGNIRVTLLKENLENYKYKIFIDTNFKKLKFRSNLKLTGLINNNSPKNYLEKTGGKIMIPLYQPSPRGEFVDEYNAMKSVENGDLDSLRKFLKKKNDLNKLWENGQTLLMTSLEFKNSEISEYLIGQNIDTSISTGNGWTTLMFSLRYGMIDMAKLLLNKGADIKGEVKDGWNNLFMSLRNGCDEELLKMLLDRGCDINKAKDNKWTPIMTALVYQDEKIAEILFQNGAGINVRDNENWSPLMYALRYGKHNLAEDMILKDKNINASNNNRWTPLLFALRNNADKCADILIKKGADVLAGNRDGNTPLHFALEYKSSDIASMIIKMGKGLDKVTRYGWSPLMVALRYEQPEAASQLLKRKVQIDGITKDGWTTLHLAVRYDQPENALSIIKRKKLDLNSVTKDGWTPLLLALRYNYPEIAKVLIRSKADINLSNKYGWTPLMISIEHDQPQLAEILIKKGALKNAKNSEGKSALDIAKEKEYFNIYKLLGGGGYLSEAPKPKVKISEQPLLLKGIFKDIIPSGKNPRVIKCGDCTPRSSLCSATLEYNNSKSEIYKYIVQELKNSGFKYDKGITARSESSSLKNRNIWGLVNFTMNTSTTVNAFTIIILSDYKTGSTKTVVDFTYTKMPRKMNMSFPKANQK